LRVSEFVRVAGLFLIVFLVGIAARVWYPFDRWPYDVMRMLADAFIVAGIVGFLLELFATKFLIQRVADSLTDKLVGRGLPPELQAQIRRIVETDLVRENYRKSYHLYDPDEG
jgi:hypothetical protein